VRARSNDDDEPEGHIDRGDIVVFRRGADDFIKRVIGRPGDRIQLVDGVIFINGTPVERHRIADFVGRDPCRPAPPDSLPVRVTQWQETLPNGVSYRTLQCSSRAAFPALAGARFFFGFRPRLLGIGKQWVGTDQVGRG
jgi:Signal peptidase, peptidase S26